MAVMEAAISASLSHPNIVKTYTYSLKAIREPTCSRQHHPNATSRLSQHNALSRLSNKPPRTTWETGSAGSNHNSGMSSEAMLSGSCLVSNTAGSTGGGSSALGAVTAFEMQIVQELCDVGTLREALDRGAFHRGPESRRLTATGTMSAPLTRRWSLGGGSGGGGGSKGPVDYTTIVEIVLDIAKGMRHLHASDVVHSDLKVCHG